MQIFGEKIIPFIVAVIVHIVSLKLSKILDYFVLFKVLLLRTHLDFLQNAQHLGLHLTV